MSYKALRAFDVKSQPVIGKSPCRSVCLCLPNPSPPPMALYDTKEKTGKTIGVWLLVLGCRFWVNNACLMEDSQESRLINPKPITHNLQPAPTVFPVFSFDVFVSVCAQRTGSRSGTETYRNAGHIQIRKMRSSFQKKDIKRVFIVFFFIRDS